MMDKDDIMTVTIDGQQRRMFKVSVEEAKKIICVLGSTPGFSVVEREIVVTSSNYVVIRCVVQRKKDATFWETYYLENFERYWAPPSFGEGESVFAEVEEVVETRTIFKSRCCNGNTASDQYTEYCKVLSHEEE